MEDIFYCKEWLGRDWPSTLVTYQTDLNGENLTLTDKNGEEIPFQISGNEISFYAELEKDDYYQYKLEDKPGQQFNNDLTFTNDENGIYLEYDNFGVKLTPTTIYETPQPILNVPGPIEIKMNGNWLGKSFFSNSPNVKITSITTQVINQGPLFIDVEVKYQAENGFYTFELRATNEAVFKIKETADFEGQPAKVYFHLNDDSWPADKAFWFANIHRMFKRDQEFEDTLTANGFDTQPNNRNIGHAQIDHSKSYKVADLNQWEPWPTIAHYIGFTDKELNNSITVMPMHAGNWRGYTRNFSISSWKGNKLAVVMPLSTIQHPKNLTFTGEYDNKLPDSLVSREWDLIGGNFQYHETLTPRRAYEGYINLNNYKNWTTDWDDQNTPYPRLVFNKEDMQNVDMDTHPFQTIIKKFLSHNDDVKRFNSWNNSLKTSRSPKWHVNWQLDRGGDDAKVIWSSLYRQSQFAWWVHRLDETLGSSHLTDDDKIYHRATLAAFCHFMAEPDFNPRGAMVHLGTPNMAINRFFALTMGAALIPDHPKYDEWMDKSKQYLEFKLSQNVTLNGTWSELITYFEAGAIHVLQATLLLYRAGKIDDSLVELAVMPFQFALNLMAPKDPRFFSSPIPVGWGHEGAGLITPYWLLAAILIKDINPKLSRNFMWAWQSQKNPQEADFVNRLLVYGNIEKEKPELKSEFLPGFGATLRAHNDDDNETYMSYRQGYNVSHSDANQCDFTLYAKGSPLSALSIFGYGIHGNLPFAKLYKEFGWHNRPRIGSQSDAGGWPGGGAFGNLHTHDFNESVDYINGSGGYSGVYLTRQIMFLKGKTANSPNYYIMKDNTNDDKPKWWYLKTLGAKNQLTVSNKEIDYQSIFGTKLNVNFLNMDSIEVESREEKQTKAVAVQANKLWTWVRDADGKIYDHMTVSAVGPTNDNITVALYPMLPTEEKPTYLKINDNVYKVTTPESTDYIFINNEVFSYADDDIEFEGKCGALRIFENEIHYIISEGPGKLKYDDIQVNAQKSTFRKAGGNQITAAATRIKPTRRRVRPVYDEIADGIYRFEDERFILYRFGKNGEYIRYEDDEVQFVGISGRARYIKRRNAFAVQAKNSYVIRLKDFKSWTYGNMSYNLYYNVNQKLISGRGDRGSYIYMIYPDGWNKIPYLLVDGKKYMTGSDKWFMKIPVIEGKRFQLMERTDPDVF